MDSGHDSANHNSNPDADTASELVSQRQELVEDLYEDEFLTTCYHQLRDGDVEQGMRDLVSALDGRRLECSDNEWNSFKKFCRLHPIGKLLHEDPFTAHAFGQQKQHTYAGDPTLLGYIHAAEQPGGAPSEVSALGGRIFQVTTHAPPCRGVRRRTQIVAASIDSLASRLQAPSILSLAAGYLHEAGCCRSLQEGRLGRWLALDSEPESVREIRERFGSRGVEAELRTVRQLLSDEGLGAEFDLVFSTGLFDYLPQPLAKRLTAKLFAFLRPGGRLLIASFPEEIAGLGYMECFMGLHLVCRSPAEMRSLTAEIDERQIEDTRLLDEHGDEILILQVTKR